MGSYKTILLSRIKDGNSTFQNPHGGGGMYERLLKDVKKTLYKTLGKSNMTFEQLEGVIVDIERLLNNRPLTYVGTGEGDEQVLTPNTIMWGQNSPHMSSIGVCYRTVTVRNLKCRWLRLYPDGYYIRFISLSNNKSSPCIC